MNAAPPERPGPRAPARAAHGAALAAVLCAAMQAAPAQGQSQSRGQAPVLVPAAPPRAKVATMAEAGGVYQVGVVSWRDLPFRTVVRQQYDFSCGSASLATLLRFQYGLAVDEATVFKAMYAAGDRKTIQKVGFSLLDMKLYLERLGLVADGYRAPLDILARTGTPAIVVIKVGRYRHFVVIKGLRGDHVLVGDPAAGLKAYRRAAFMRVWDGTLFAIHAAAPRGGALGKAVFNSPVEWGYVPDAPLEYAMREAQQPLSELTRDIPFQFQVLPVMQLAGALGTLR